MTKHLFSAVLLLTALAGCSMCSDCCDHSPPVADGPYAGVHGRAGSVLGGAVIEIPPVEDAAEEAPSPTPTPPAPPSDEELAEPPTIEPPTIELPPLPLPEA
jgi:hypothetical protein